MTKQTAVNRGRGIEENQVPAHTLSSWCFRIITVTVLASRGLKARRGGGWGVPQTLMFHSSDLHTLPRLQYENITVMKILLIGVASFYTNCTVFSAFQCLEGKCKEQRWKPSRHHSQCSIMTGGPLSQLKLKPFCKAENTFFLRHLPTLIKSSWIAVFSDMSGC